MPRALHHLIWLSILLVPLPGTAAQEGAGPERLKDRHFDDSDFRSLFDGSSLAGWVTSGGRYDGKASWTVEDGAITGREGPKGEGGLIYTEEEYDQFIFTVDVKITWPFDSGIFLRMAPRPRGKGSQVTIDYREGGEVGGIYSDGFMQHNPEAAAKLRGGEWNHFEVRCTGDDMLVEAWMNGEPISDFAYPREGEGYELRGKIGLQVHGAVNAEPDAAVQFKNMRIRELPPHDPQLFQADPRGLLEPTGAGLEAGWEALFNGRDLEGWEAMGDGEGFRAEDGVLALLVEGSSHNLRTTRDFEDFELRLDFKTGFMANSGLFLRGNRAGGNPAYSGCEIQILDDFNWERVTDSKLKPWQFSGSLYGAVRPGVANALKPLGRWNTFELRYQGSELTVELNGHELYSVDTHELEHASPPFAERAPRGFIGLQRHASPQASGEAYTWFRNILLREL